MQIRQAIVKFRAGDVKKTQYGERQNIVVAYADGSEDKLWFKAGRQPHCSLKKGQGIQIAIEQRDGKETKKLIETEVSPSSPSSVNEPSRSADVSPTPTYKPLSDDRKREIAAYVEEQAKLYRFCLQQAMPMAREVDGDLEDARAIATTLFISAQRKFGL